MGKDKTQGIKPRGKCSSCLFFYLHDSGKSGDCREQSPRLILAVEDRDTSSLLEPLTYSGWPNVDQDEKGCGKFEHISTRFDPE